MLFCAFVCTAWAQEIQGVKEIPTTALDFSTQTLQTGYYLIKQTNTADYQGYLKATDEAVGAVVTPSQSNTPTVNARNEATYIWYVEVYDGGKFSVATANKKAAWQAPTQRQKNLVAYDSKAVTLELESDFASLNGSTQTLVKAWWEEQSCYSYVHASGHNLGSWNDQNPASLFYLEFYPIAQDNLVLVDLMEVKKQPLVDLISEVKRGLGSLPLQTTDSNAPFYLSATVQGDAPISAAIDNNPATHYGSTWGSEVGHHHYWQVDLADASNLEEFTFSYITRANGSDTPTKINVQGSTDGEAFTDIVVLTDGLPTAGGSTYASAKISNDGYRYIRFEVPSTTNNYSKPEKPEQEVTIAIAEFSLFTLDENQYSEKDKELKAVIDAAQQVVDDMGATEEQINEAIKNIRIATLVKPTYPFTITTDDSQPALYTIKSGRGEGYWYTYDEEDGMIALQAFTGGTNQQWYFKEVITEDFNCYLQLLPVLGGGKVMSYQNTENGAAKIVAQPVDADGWTSYWTFVDTNGAEPYGLKTANGANYLSNNGGTHNKMGMWNAAPSADAGTAFTLKEYHPVVDVVYNVIYQGQVRFTQQYKEMVGAEYQPVNVPYGVTVEQPIGTIAKEDVVDGVVTKNFNAEVNLPFEAAADYASIKNWYYIQMHSTPQYTKYIQAVEGFIEWADAEVNANEIDTYTWGFIGNPFDGFKLVNYGKGAEMGVNSTGEGNPAMGGIASATAWTIKPSASNKDAQYFCFQYPGSANYMNAQSGKIAFWGSADNGSTMWVTERDLSGATELQAVIDQVEAFVAAGVAAGTTVGYLTSESVNNVATVLAAAKEAVATKTGCIEAQAALQAAVAAVETIQPEEGKFYVIASAMPESDARSGQKMYVNNEGGMQFDNGNAIANVFQFVSDGDGKFFLKSVDRGTYMNSAKSHNGGQETAVAAVTASAKAIAIANMGRANVVSLIPNGGAMMHAQASGSSVVAWNNTENAGASAWVISEVNIEDFTHTVSVTEAGWATLYLGYNAEIPAGVTAYAVSSVDAESATLEEVKNVLPANTAVLLNATAGDYNFDFTAETAEVANNVLRGTVFNTAIPEDIYVLGNGTAGVGFYKAIKNRNEDTSDDIVEGEGEEAVTTPVNDAVLNNAFKAYLPANGVAAQALRFNFGGTTAIESVVSGINANAAIYDLSGRRVEKATKGIYIVNGKKMIVK